MNIEYKIKHLIFEEKGGQILFAIERIEDQIVFYYAANELFQSEELLASFSVKDLRLIAYFASIQEFQADQAFLQQLNS